MRLSTEQVRTIRETVRGELGPDARVILFGSRLDDSARGRDIDLMIITPNACERPALSAARLAVKLERKLEGRRVDVVLLTPESAPQPIHSAARAQGVEL
jgi:predicted nucleotidyltransferase